MAKETAPVAVKPARPGRGSGSRRVEAVVRCIIVAAAVALWGTGTLAREAVELEWAEPAPQEWVHHGPAVLHLRFSAPVTLSGSDVRLSSYRRSAIPGRLEQPAPAELTFTPEEPLDEATYEVTWTVRTPSGETASGRYGFTYLAPKPDWQQPLDRREINRVLGNLVPGWVLIIPAAVGAGGILWIAWAAWRK